MKIKAKSGFQEPLQEEDMLDLRFVRENPEENDTAVKNGENKKERK